MYQMLKAIFWKVVPYIGPYLILLGVAKQVMYYRVFGVQIVQYLELSETLALFMDDVVTWSFFLLAAVAGLLMPSGYRLISKGKGVKDIPADGKFYTFCFVAILFVYQLSSLIGNYTYNRLMYAIVFLAVYYVLLWRCFYSKQVAEQVSAAGRYTLFFSLFCLAWFLDKGQKEAEEIRFRRKNTGIFVQLDSTRVVSDSTQYFIGKTNAYLFMFNEKNKTADVYPMSRVRELHFPAK